MGAICWGFIRRESQITFVIQSNRTALTVEKVDARVQLKCYKVKMFVEKLSSHYYVVNKKWFFYNPVGKTYYTIGLEIYLVKHYVQENNTLLEVFIEVYR